MSEIYTNLKILVEHFSPDSDNANKEGYVVDAALSGAYSPDVNIQPASPTVEALYGGAPGKTFTMFATASGIQETDRLTVSGTLQKYVVKGKSDYNYDVGQHIEFVIVQPQ